MFFYRPTKIPRWLKTIARYATNKNEICYSLQRLKAMTSTHFAPNPLGSKRTFRCRRTQDFPTSYAHATHSAGKLKSNWKTQSTLSFAMCVREKLHGQVRKDCKLLLTAIRAVRKDCRLLITAVGDNSEMMVNYRIVQKYGKLRNCPKQSTNKRTRTYPTRTLSYFFYVCASVNNNLLYSARVRCPKREITKLTLWWWAWDSLQVYSERIRCPFTGPFYLNYRRPKWLLHHYHVQTRAQYTPRDHQHVDAPAAPVSKPESHALLRHTGCSNPQYCAKLCDTIHARNIGSYWKNPPAMPPNAMNTGSSQTTAILRSITGILTTVPDVTDLRQAAILIQPLHILCHFP